MDQQEISNNQQNKERSFGCQIEFTNYNIYKKIDSKQSEIIEDEDDTSNQIFSQHLNSSNNQRKSMNPILFTKKLMTSKQLQTPTVSDTLQQLKIVNKCKQKLFKICYLLTQSGLKFVEKSNFFSDAYNKKNSQLKNFNTNQNAFQTNFLILTLLPVKIQEVLQKFLPYYDIISCLLVIYGYWFALFICAFASKDQNVLNGSELLLIFVSFLNIFFYKLQEYLNPSIFDSKQSKQWYNQEKLLIIHQIIKSVLLLVIYLNYQDIQYLREFLGISLSILIYMELSYKFNHLIDQLFILKANNNILDISNLFLVILLFAHTMACIWYYIGETTSNSWLQYYNLEDQNIWIKYTYSFYWSITTMSTVGYGDITPKNEIEIIFAIIMILLSGLVFGYSLNSIGSIVRTIHDKDTQQKRELTQINAYMNQKQVTNHLQNRVKIYFKEKNIQHQFDEQKEVNSLIHQLPIQLRNDLDIDIKKRIINQIKLLYSNFSLTSLQKIQMKLQRQLYQYGDIIQRNDSQDQQFLYFIQDGEVQLIEEKSKQVISILKQGEIFGQYQFFTGQNNGETAISTSNTEIYKLSRKDVEEIIKENSKDFQRFHNIKDTVLYSKNLYLLQQKCPVCQQGDHSFFNCQFVTYKPNIYLKILKLNKQKNNRMQYIRENMSFRTLKFLNQTQQSVQEYQYNMNYQSYDTLLMDNNSKERKTEHSIEKQDSLNLAEGIISQKYQISTFGQQKHIFHTNSLKSEQIVNKTQNFDIYKPSLLTLGQIQIDDQLQNQNMQLINFDKIQTYLYYLPHNNINKILKSQKKEQMKKSFRNHLLKKGKSYYQN